MACARAIFSSSPFLSSGPITESSHCSCLLIVLSSVRLSPVLAFEPFAPLPFGSAARAIGDAAKRQLPASAAQRSNLDRIETTSTWGVGVELLLFGPARYLTSAFSAFSPTKADVP